MVTLRLLPNVSKETLAQIATIGKAEEYRPTGETAAEVIRDTYGVLNSKTIDLVFGANPGLRSLGAVSQTIALPPGPYWSFGTEVTIPPGGNVWSSTVGRTGVYGEKTIARLKRLNPEIGNRFKDVKPGEILRVDTAGLTSFEVDPNVTPDLLARMLERLRRAVGVFEVQVGPPARLIPQWSSPALSTAPAGCLTRSPKAWHFADIGIPGCLPTTISNRVTVAVLDSGIIEGDGRFRGVLWHNSREEGGRRGDDNDGNGYIADVIGVDMIKRGGYPNDDITEPDLHSHGTHVAGLISGRLLDAPRQADFDKAVSLLIVKVAKSDGSVDIGALVDGIYYAAEKGARIVNLSLQAGYSPSLQTAIEALKSQVLFVVAAGNGTGFNGTMIDGTRSYPAVLSDRLPNVISVGALSGGGRLACFSNYGLKSVDLAAPGVDIESTVSGGSAILSGTSQAAPLVTLAAALLFSVNPRLTPNEVKQRILGTVDPLPGLADTVQTSGKPNICKIVAGQPDWVALKAGGGRPGKVVQPTEISVASEAVPVPTARVIQIVFDYPKVGQDLVAFLKDGKVIYRSANEPIQEVSLTVGRKVERLQRDGLKGVVFGLQR